MKSLHISLLCLSMLPAFGFSAEHTAPEDTIRKFTSTGNPLFTHTYTADPAALIHNNVFYLYAGQDAGDGRGYNIPNWQVFSTEDMETWYEYPMPLKATHFSWARGNSSWASQVIERNGKFYWYVTALHVDVDGKGGKAIGVAVSDSPTGPFVDARGSAIVTNNMTTQWTDISWDDIDPTVWIDNDGQAYLFWGNTQCYYAKLKENMIELDSEIMPVDLPYFTEAPWIHKRDDWYYLSYAAWFPEKTVYAMSKNINGPWEYKGILNELAGNCNTNHQAIVEYKGKWYFVYHNGGTPIPGNGGSFLRSVCIDYLYHNEDGTLKRIQMTTEGVDKIKDPNVAYLAAYMKGDDDKSMYYAISQDKFNFKVLNNGKPIVKASFDDQLIRDPMILKDKNGMYHMVATVSWKNRPFTIWDSKDLITWENERLVDVAPEGATKTWAPEFAYDEENDIYFVHWTAELNNDWNTAAIYYATTHDFVHFSEPHVLYRDDEGILDANIIKVDGVYHLIYRKDGLWVVTSPHAQGPYTNPYQLTAENVEGPFAFALNDESGYAIVWDYFGRSLGFGLWTSPDFKQWTKITNENYPYYNESVEFPESIRHGSIIGITQQELDKLLDSF